MTAQDTAWLRRIHDQHWTQNVRLAALLMGSAEEAEDIVVDAMVSLYQRRDEFDQMDEAASYLRSVVVNRTRAERRSGLRLSRPGHAPPRPARAEKQTVLEVIDALPERQREVLVLRCWMGIDEHEIAETLGISRGALAHHAHRGLRTLRLALGGDRHA